MSELIQTVRKKSPREKAATLVVTLLVMVLLSTITVAFMQAVSSERTAARSIANRYQAELAADAGIQQALSQITSFISSNPYHAVGYTNLANQTFTILHGHPSYTSTGTPRTRYLISGDNSDQPPPAMNDANSIAINFTNSTYPGGWVGSSLNATTGNYDIRACRAPWVYILRNPSLPHQPNSASANYNPRVARFAYWVEDETSKIDLMAAGNANAGGAFQRQTNATSPSDVDIGAAPLVGGQPIPTNNTAQNQSIITHRNRVTNLPAFQGVLGFDSNVGTIGNQRSRFYTTYSSFANDLSGTGQRRININALVTDGPNAQSPASQGDITGDLQDVIYAITGTQTPSLGIGSGRVFNNLQNTNSPLPNFGNRFFAASIPSATQREIYLKKIAANIRDYIDNDSQPTFINSAGQVESGTRPQDCWQTGQWPQAIGKEAAPFYTEHAIVGIEKAWQSGNPAQGTLKIDHYIEFSNPSTRDYVAPPGSFLKLSNLMPWRAGSYPDLEPNDFEMDISNVRFPAGGAVVITTNPDSADDPPNLISNTSNNTLVRRPPVTREGSTLFTNRSTDEQISGSRGFQFAPRDSTASDFQARLVFGNNNGIVGGLPVVGFSTSSFNPSTPFNFRGQNLNNLTRYVYSSGLRGNMPENSASDSRSGDPRSLAEQLSFQRFDNNATTGNGENTRFYGAIQGTSVIPGQSTLGRIFTSFVDPERSTGAGSWPDYTHQLNETASRAYAVISDQPMASIAELGHIYDPGQRRATTTIEAARGGGRTLRIGQPDDSIGVVSRFSTQWQNAAWRLADIFGTNATRTTVELNPVSRGKININSVARDGGTALRGLLRSWNFQPSPHSDPNTASRQLSSTEIDSIISSVANYINANGPIMERGEISQIPYFSASSINTIAGQQVRTTADRSREQILASVMEMLTTRSASFSVYCIGEAIQESANGAIQTLSRDNTAMVFRIDPVIASTVRSTPTDYRATPIYEIQ